MSGMPIRNVQRPTFNSQLSTECPKGFMWAGYGDRHDVWADGGANRGTDTIFGSGRRIFDTRTQIWGQTRCPVCRSGTFNVKRSTLNFQRGDRKGEWWPGYGDRHAIWRTGLWPGGPEQAPAGRSKAARRPGMGTDTIFDMAIRNVQRATLNSQLSTG